MNTVAALHTKSGKRSMTNNIGLKNYTASIGNLQSHYVSWQTLWTIDKQSETKKSLINHKKEKEMQTKTLNAKNLKAVLWDSINQVKTGSMTHADADSIATSAREILRATHTQLRISQASNREVPTDVIEFSESTVMIKSKPKRLKSA